MTDVTLATAADADALSRFAEAAFVQTFGHIYDPLGYTKLGPIDFDLPEGQPAEGATELHQLYVAAEAKGTGVAAALMQWGIDWARQRASILYLSVFTENPRAQAFYRRYGFVDVGRNAFRVGNHIDEDRIWRLDL
ncbi:GNAT family N-acetyltransferase [Aeromicrobium sp. REDSEA-S32_B7]|uniref:GNAT family N-acetyltransferase n=1 Tax=Aeromicrobium sp. REDSEA-S32_B7 TaxID=1811526 RepID=UPI000B178378|nr:GNAT family N-acetyltransferase [Aeromicrobium sp. REDSEA-S32_B7]